MAEKTEFADGGYRLPIHFGVDASRLPASDVITSLKSVTRIVHEVERQFTGRKKIDGRTQIYVTPIESGSLGIIFIIIGGFVSLVKLEESKNFAIFVEKVTGKKYEGGKIGAYLGQLTKYILKTKVPEINEAKPDDTDFNKAINAKSKFYEMLQRNSDIKNVRFDDDKSDLIPRDQFELHIAPSRKRLLKYREEYRTVIIASVATLDEHQAKWSFINFEGWKEFKAYMEDSDFKRGLIRKSQYTLKGNFYPYTIYALFKIEQIEEGGVVRDGNKIHVMKVYRFNDIEITKPPVEEKPVYPLRF